jgi:hypothetical protein
VHASVEIVKPGGTGSPALVISARPDPFPPSRSFIVRSPSALPSPKKYTYLLARGFFVGTAVFLCATGRVFATVDFPPARPT